MSSTFFSKVSFAINQIRRGKIKPILKGFIDKLYSEKLSFGLKRDSNKKQKPPRKFINLSFRLFEKTDSEFFKTDEENTTLIEQLPKCYIATTPENIPCFRMWLLDSSQNKKIKEFWGDSYPQLNYDEVLMESAFTTVKYRGLGIMPYAMAFISEEAKKYGARYTITVTPITSVNSLRASYFAGFRPYTLRREKYFLFKKSVFYEEISNELMNHYHEITNTTLRKSKK